MTRFLCRSVLLVFGLWSGFTPSVVAQATQWDAQQVELSRADLDSLLANYEQTAASNAYSGALREKARREAALIRTRLAEGDFQVGDQIALVVEGEDKLTGGFVVQDGPVLVLPEIGRISLGGVLRSELESHLAKELGRFIRSPTVHARSSIRLMVIGGIGNAGYHVVPTNTVFSDVLTIAGGPGPDARLERIRVERGSRVIWEGETLQQAIIQGRTLDQLSIRAGDQIVVPVQKAGGFTQKMHTAALIISPIALVVTTLWRIF